MIRVWIVTTYVKNEKGEILESFPYKDETSAKTFFNALCNTSTREISNPCMIHKSENEFIYCDLLEERTYKVKEYVL